jgi:cation transport ATPase
VVTTRDSFHCNDQTFYFNSRSVQDINMEARRQAWAAAVLLLAVLYTLVGVLFAFPDTHVRMWRLAAWLVSAAAFVMHVGFERFRLHNAPRSAALHVALAAALGAFGLAVAAIVNSVVVGSGSAHQRLLLIALVAWPAITGVPAFLVGLVASWVLARIPWSTSTQ